jgi:molybdopterin-guanine dinucleotide biosynthesis protein A
MEITGIVLAGGKSSRMGKDKGLINLNGELMVNYSINTLKPICSSIIIICNNNDYDHLGYPVYKDIHKDCGPLAGIHTGLFNSKTDNNIVLSCDSPFVPTELLSHLIANSEGCDIVVPTYYKKIYPLTALYKKACIQTFEESLKQKKLKVKKTIELLSTNIVEFSSDMEYVNDKIFTNINTLADLEISKKE